MKVALRVRNKSQSRIFEPTFRILHLDFSFDMKESILPLSYIPVALSPIFRNFPP